METNLRIAVADDEPDMREYYGKILPRMGHEVVGLAGDGRQLLEHCRKVRPDLVITDIKMPNMDGIAAAEQIYKEGIAVPVILVSAYHDKELIERAEADHVMAYLIKPVKQADLEPAIGLAMRRFQQFQAIQKEADDLRQALANRKIIERAKGILMQRLQLDEPDAFRRLQKLASDKNEKLVDIACTVITADETFS